MPDSMKPPDIRPSHSDSSAEVKQGSKIVITYDLIEEITEKVYQIMLAELRIENERRRCV